MAVPQNYDYQEIALTLPILPVATDMLSSDKTAHYHVNLATAECTCPDWQKHRSHLPPNHVGRCCKHVVSLLCQEASEEKIQNQWLWKIIVCHWEKHVGLDPEARLVEITFPKGKALLVFGHTTWVNVITDEPFPTELGWNVQEHRWSRGESTRGALTIRKAIGDLFPIYSTNAAANDDLNVTQVNLEAEDLISEESEAGTTLLLYWLILLGAIVVIIIMAIALTTVPRQ